MRSWVKISLLGYLACHTSSMLAASSRPATAPATRPKARRTASTTRSTASRPHAGATLTIPYPPAWKPPASRAGQRW